MSSSRMLVRLGIAAFVGIMLAGPGAAVFPRTLRWGAWAACSGYSIPAPERYVAPFDRPGESQVRMLCIAPDGTAHDRTLAAIGGLWVLYVMGLMVLLSLLSLRSGGRSPGLAASSGPPRPVPAAVEAEARELFTRGQTISAIKRVRQATGMGLKEARDWVEELPLRAAAPSTSDVVHTRASDRLAEAKRLLDAGLITAEEFARKKEEIVAEL